MDLKKVASHSYVKFFFTGATGVLLNLMVTWLLVKLIVPESHFYIASIIGTACNLLYNFTLHTLVTFKTKSKHKRRFSAFILYSIIMASCQEFIIAHVTPLIGTQFLIIIKAFIVLGFSVITYIVFKLILFKEK